MMGIRLACLDPNEDALPYLELVTLRAGARQRGLVTCDKFLEVETHFIGGRTLPCLDEGCAACDLKRPRRYEAFASVVWSHNTKHQIVRLTRNAMLMAKSALIDVCSPRGYVLEIERRTARANGRLVVTVDPTIVPGRKMPDAPDLLAHLARVWRIDGMEVVGDEREYVAQLQAFVSEAVAKGGAKHAI